MTSRQLTYALKNPAPPLGANDVLVSNMPPRIKERHIPFPLAEVVLVNEHRAGYNFMKDIVVIPSRHIFRDPEYHGAIVTHELMHWTGHATRLNRPYATTKKASSVRGSS